MRLTRTAVVALLGILLVSTVACTRIFETSQPTPSSEWTGPNGEKEYEYVSCGTHCHYVGGNGQDIELVNNPAAKDPSWAELKSFLSQDNTDKQLYIEGSFVCADFAEMLHNNAEKAGIRAAYVSLDLSGGGNHACDAFNTTNEGLIYIDDTGTSSYSACSADKKVAVSIGSEYIPVSIFPCAGWSSTWDSMGTVTNINIQW